MGWYGADFFCLTKCIAANNISCHIFFRKIHISTAFRIRTIHARNDEDARKKFYDRIFKEEEENKIKI